MLRSKTAVKPDGPAKVIDREWIVKKVLFVLAMMTVLGILLIVLMVTKESIPALTKAGPEVWVATKAATGNERTDDAP